MTATAGTKTLVPEEEYLHGHFGDRTPEYVDGEVVERTMPNSVHSEVQAEIAFIFRSMRDRHKVHVRPEIRLRVAEGRYRVADVAVFHPNKPVAFVPDETPVAVIEIISPADLWMDIHTKLREYTSMGVANVWLVDPEARSLMVHTSQSGLATVQAFELPQFELRITIDDLLP